MKHRSTNVPPVLPNTSCAVDIEIWPIVVFDEADTLALEISGQDTQVSGFFFSA